MTNPVSVSRSRGWTVASLGTAQTLAWASSIYLPAMVAQPMARDLGVSVPTVFAAFSAALVVSGLLGPSAGKAIDRWGGRPVLSATSLIFAAGLLLLGLATGPYSLFAAWLIIGIGMGSGLYEAAFAALVRLHGMNSRGAITGVTLIAGFASTVGWPLTSLLEVNFGWRSACLTWAALHLVLGLPLNLTLPRVPPEPDSAQPPPASPAAPAATAAAPVSAAPATTDPAVPVTTAPAVPAADVPALSPVASLLVSILLAYVFAGIWFISTAMAAHLPRLLEMTGASLATAVAAGALVGPAQVAARLLEFGVLRRVHPLYSAGLALLAHPVGALAMLAGGAPVAAFAVLHGAGNGILTIAKGTLPLVIFGPLGYGQRQGLLTVPARITQALSPYLFGLCLDRWGASALWLSGGVGVSALLALLLIPLASRR